MRPLFSPVVGVIITFAGRWTECVRYGLVLYNPTPAVLTQLSSYNIHGTVTIYPSSLPPYPTSLQTILSPSYTDTRTQTDGQTGRQTDRQSGRQTDGQTDRFTLTNRQMMNRHRKNTQTFVLSVVSSIEMTVYTNLIDRR